MKSLFPFFIFSSIILLSNQCIAQKLKVDSLFQEFKEDVQIELEEHYGRFTFDDDTQIAYYLLMDNATIQDLLKYVNDSNPIVRTYMFTGLVRKQASDEILADIYNRYSNDTTEYTTGSGCIVLTNMVNNQMKRVFNSRDRLTEINYQERIADIRNQFGLVIPGVDHNTIKKADLLQLDSLKTNDAEFVIYSFILKTGEESLESSTNKMTQEMKELINHVQVNDAVVFDDVKVKCPDNSIRTIPAKVVWIK